MKRYNLFFKNVFKPFALIKNILLIACVYSSIILIGLLNNAKFGDGSSTIGIFDLIASLDGALGSTNHYMYMFLAIPIITIIFNQLIERNERSNYIISHRTRFRVFHAQVFVALMFSLILTLFTLIISFLIGSVIVGLVNTWVSDSGTISKTLSDSERFLTIIGNVTTGKILMTLFATKFLGFYMISSFVLFLRQFTKSTPVILIILLLLASIDHSGTVSISIFTWNGTLTIHNWIEPMITVYHSGYMIIVSLILYGITGWLYERKDFYS